MADVSTFEDINLTRRSRNQNGNTFPSAVRANSDDPPIHIRPTCSRVSGCEE